jgi:GT2 family glycosyltransferase
MNRAPVSLVILAWNAWAETQACLESLRPTLGVDDQVIVVDNGSTDATPVRLRSYPWVEVLTNRENRGFAAGCNQGAAAAENAILLFLNNDTVLTGRWIDPLVAALQEPDIVAAGPRSNYVSGNQVVSGATYPAGDRQAMRRFARDWSRHHVGEFTETERLVGFCLAVDSSAFQAVGGYDEGYEIGGFEDDDLCHRLRLHGGRLVVAHESFVHHAGHRTFDANNVDWFEQQGRNQARFLAKFTTPGTTQPLISACVLAGEEEEAIESCLASLGTLVDEVVVIVDASSRDDTARVAKQFGATIVVTAWTDDCAAARNLAIESSTSKWVLHLDACERLECGDPDLLRRRLDAVSASVDALVVAVEHRGGRPGQDGFVVSSRRLTRAERARWHGRVAPELAKDHAGSSLETSPLDGLTLVRPHRASTVGGEPIGDVVTGGRAGSPRPRQAVARCSAELAYACRTAGLFDRALDAARDAEMAASPGPVLRLALREHAIAAIATGRPDDGLDVVERLRSATSSRLLPDLLEAAARRALGDHGRAAELLGRSIQGGADEDGHVYPSVAIVSDLADSLRKLSRPGEGADLLLNVLQSGPVTPGALVCAAACLEDAGRSVGEVAAALTPATVAATLHQLIQAPAPVASRMLEAAYLEREDLRMAVLAAASLLARRLPVEDALRWSSRLRGYGLADACPLRPICEDPTRSTTERSRAAAAGYALFRDDELAATWSVVYTLATPSERTAILAETSAICSDLVTGERDLSPTGPPAERPRVPAGTLRATIVIPCWNRAQYTLRCLESIAAHTPPGSYEVILVDNGSTDVTSRLTSSDDGTITVIRNPTNLGYARACNQGAWDARGDILVMLNNDTEVLPGWLPPLLADLDGNPGAGIVGARLLLPDGSLQHAGVVLGTTAADGLLDGLHRYDRQPGNHPPALQRTRLRVVTGALMAVRADLFASLGGFDEQYVNGNEDVDLCLRAGERGWQVVYEPACCSVHHESASGPERFSHVGANRVLLSRRWKDLVLTDDADGGPVAGSRGCSVVGVFAQSSREGSPAACALVEALEALGIPVVTTSLDPAAEQACGGPGFRHRLGPRQETTVLVVPSSSTAVGVDTLAEWRTSGKLVVVVPPGCESASRLVEPLRSATTLALGRGPLAAADVATTIARLVQQDDADVHSAPHLALTRA